jgi:hypothetical protein
MNIIDMTVEISWSSVKCAQNRRCQMPRSRRFYRLFEILSLRSISRENCPPISESNNRYPQAAVPIGNVNDLASSGSC